MKIASLLLAYILVISAAGYSADSPAYGLRFGIGEKKKRIWTFQSKDLSEIRYDKNGDQKIDQWLIEYENIWLKLFFTGNQVHRIYVTQRLNGKTVTLFYLRNNGGLSLKAAILTKKSKSYYGVPNTQTISKVNCAPKSISSFFHPNHWNELTSSLGQEQQKENWGKRISQSCSSQQKAVEQSIRQTLGFNLHGDTLQNKFLSCMASSETTEELFLDLVMEALSFQEGKGIQIECSAEKNGCYGPSLKHSAPIRVLTLPLPGSTCAINPTLDYPKFIVHEVLHDIAPFSSESTVRKLSEICEQGVVTENLESSQDREMRQAEGRRQTAAATIISSFDQEIADFSGNDKTDLSPQIAEKNLPPETILPLEKNISDLNASFKGKSGYFTSDEGQINVRMVDPLKEKIGYVLSAVSSTVASASATPRYEKKRTISSIDRNIPQPLEDLTEQGEPHHAFLKEHTTEDSVKKSIQEDFQQKTAKGKKLSPLKNQNLNASRGPRGTLESQQRKVPQEPTPPPEDDQVSEARDKIVSAIAGKSAAETREFIKKNEPQLIRLKILVLDRSNKVWGIRDPNRAAVLIRENSSGKFVVED